jgi:hypothetical protein
MFFQVLVCGARINLATLLQSRNVFREESRFLHFSCTYYMYIFFKRLPFFVTHVTHGLLSKLAT